MIVMESQESRTALKLPKHHVQQELCKTRPPYRQGKKLTAVKAYTVNNESQHLFVYGVPKINLRRELKQLFASYGRILAAHVVPDHETEPFTECFHLHFERIQSARIAKRFLDARSFYGGVLHVCYAPEFESVQEVRAKLLQRQKDVLSRLHGCRNGSGDGIAATTVATVQGRKRKYPAIELSDERLSGFGNVWEGVPKELDPRLPQPKVPKPGEPHKHYLQTNKSEENKVYGPLLPENNCSSDDEISLNSSQKKSQVLPMLIPTQVVKNQNVIKRIVFRNKNNS